MELGLAVVPGWLVVVGTGIAGLHREDPKHPGKRQSRPFQIPQWRIQQGPHWDSSTGLKGFPFLVPKKQRVSGSLGVDGSPVTPSEPSEQWVVPLRKRKPPQFHGV